MKQLSQLLTALVFCSLMIFISCKGGKDPDPVDPADAIGTQLASSWTLSSATVDGGDRSEWTGFGLTLTYDPATNKGNYQASGVPINAGAEDVWPTSGTFDLAVGAATTATRSDGTPITVTVSASQLVLSFPISGSGRVSAFDGNWVFTLSK